MKILGCAYRLWAKQILNRIRDDVGVHLELISDPDGLTMKRCLEFKPDIILLYGWSWRVPKEITESFTCLCLHPSPLPKYRGGSPLQNQILAGETASAVSIFQMDGGIDAGPLCAQVPFYLEGNLDEILQRIKVIGVTETRRIIREYRDNTLKFWPQTGKPTHCKRRTPEESRITAAELVESPAEWLYNKIRCLQDPYPNAYIECGDGQKLYLTGAHL